MTIEYLVTWPNGRQSRLSEEGYEVYKDWFRIVSQGRPEDPAKYKALLDAEKVEVNNGD